MMDNQIVIYQNPNGNQVKVTLENETVWLNQKQIAYLFGSERSVITKHINNILKDGELCKNSACANFAHAAEAVKYKKRLIYAPKK
jgi:hypothetical protein